MSDQLPLRSRPRSRASTRWFLRPIAASTLAMIVICAAPSVRAQDAFYDRNKIPGTYTVGFYADPQGKSRELKLDKGENEFELYIGVTGDSTKVFSALVFRLELPPDVRLNGPIRWATIPGLKQTGSANELPGAQIEFNVECQQQRGPLPLMLGRLPLRVSNEFKGAVIEPLPHVNFGLSVELCQDEKAWPKPFAKPLPLSVERKRSWWQRITGAFQ